METFSRDEFIAERWRYRPGEHVTLLGPTGSGKTTLAMQLLQATVSHRLPAIVLAGKPRDATMTRFTKDAGFKKVDSWPPKRIPWIDKPTSGWTVWPKHTFDVDEDDARLYDVFHTAMMDSYKHGDRIVFVDELLLCRDLKDPDTGKSLERDASALWTRGRSMGCAIWGGSQRPAHVPLHAYTQAEHLFLHHDPDKRSRDRFSEIGGVDPVLVAQTVMGMRRHQFLYIRRDGPALCIIDR